MKSITKKLHLTLLCSFSLFFLGLNTSVYAQKEVKEKKIIIITTKKIDKDGKEITEKIVKEGEEANDAIIDQLIEDAKKEGKEINIQIETEITEIVKNKNGKLDKEIRIEVNEDNIGNEDIMILKIDDGKIINTDYGKEEKGKQEVEVSIDNDGKIIIKKRYKRVKKREDVEEKLKKLDIKLPELGKPVANYVHAVTSNNWVFLAGKGPKTADGKNIVGKLGKDLTIEQGYEAAKWAGINSLAALKGEIGDLNRVVRIVKVKGMVNAVSNFTEHSKVINGFSDLMVAVFGERGKHARAAVGMSSLPGNMAVEVEMIVEVE